VSDPNLIRRMEILGMDAPIRALLGCDFGSKVWVGPPEERPTEPTMCDVVAVKRMALHVDDEHVLLTQFCAQHAAVVEGWSTRRDQE
jgi:hypothetical protein